MTKIILSADSTCDIGDELKAEFDVRYTSLHVNLQDKEYLDNVTITVDKVFETYFQDKSLPKTSAVSIGEYAEHFKALLQEGDAVIHIGLGGALSCTCNNAELAAQELENVYVIDSQNLSTGMGQLVVRAGKMIRDGLEVTEIVEKIKAMRSCVHASFVLDNMDFLAAGGRCPSILAQVGKMVQIRPQITVNNADGSMKMDKIYRGKLQKVLLNYVEDQLTAYPDIIPDDIFVTHSSLDEETLTSLCNKVRELIPVQRIHLTRCCVTIGSHCGPNCMGVLFVTES